MGDFDHKHETALQGIWFLGDVHGEFRHIAQALRRHHHRHCPTGWCSWVMWTLTTNPFVKSWPL
jgi:hypothetical protein